MPLTVTNGALATHPIVGARGVNPFYDAATTHAPTVRDADVLTRLGQLDRLETLRYKDR